MPGSWEREIGGMLQGIGTAGRSFSRRLWLKRGCCANDDDDDDDDVSAVVNERMKLWWTDTGSGRQSIRREHYPFANICALLRHYAACSGNSLPTFRNNPSVPYSWVKKRIC